MSIQLHNLQRHPGAVKARKRIGRGPGSGWGKTAGRGSKGQKSRSGYSHKVGFEGGQMPLYRRLPKRGFHNIFKKEYAIVNLDTLNTLEEGTLVEPLMLLEKGIIKKVKAGLKVLGNGKLEKKLTVRAHKFSKKAKEEIIKAGGKVEVIDG